MVDRAHLSVTAIDEEGDVQAGKAVVVYESNGTTPYAGTIYNASTGGAVVTSHTTDSLGRIDRWVENTDARPVRLTVAGRAGQIPSAFAIDPSILIRQGTDDAVVLDGYSGAADYALRVRSQNATTSKSLAVENQAGSKVLTVERASSNQNDVVRINLLNATVPTQNLLEVRAAKGVAYQLVDVELQSTAPGIVSSALRVTVTRTVAGISNITAGIFTARQSQAVNAGSPARAIEAHVSTTVSGGAPSFISAVQAISDQLTSGVPADAAFYAGGLGAGFSYGFYYESAAGAHIASISSAGVLRLGATTLKSGGQYVMVAGSSGTQTIAASASYATLAEMTVAMSGATATTGGDLLVWFNGAFTHTLTGSAIVVALALDGGTEVFAMSINMAPSAQTQPISVVGRFTGVAAGPHTVRVRWLTNANSASANGNDRYLLVQEQPH